MQMVMSLQISRALLDRIRAIAAADPAREVCGLLLGQSAEVTDIVEAPNVAPDPSRHFEIDPAVQIAAMKSARAGGRRVLGCYHSHPTGRAKPSLTDLTLAEPGTMWLILAGDDATAWQRDLDRFQQLSLDVR
jgi:proteasome lid subunit RPN8/RPN11